MFRIRKLLDIGNNLILAIDDHCNLTIYDIYLNSLETFIKMNAYCRDAIIISSENKNIEIAISTHKGLYFPKINMVKSKITLRP